MTKKTTFVLLAIAGCFALAAYGCQNQAKAVDKKPEHTFSVNGSVHEIKIVPENPTFPEHEGKAEFISYCAMCHSLKYISMQPDFPRKTWNAEVHKMVDKYKAPIDSAVCNKIVDYLVAIKSGV